MTRRRVADERIVSSHSFPIRFDRFRTTEEVLAATEHTYVDSAVTSTNFPMGRLPERERNIVFIEGNFFDHRPTSEEVLAEAVRRGWKRPTHEDALLWDEQCPDEQGVHVFLHEPKSLYGGPRVLGVSRDGRNRSVDLHWFGRRWFREFRFGFVSESA